MIWRLKMKFKLKETWKTINGFPDYEVSTYGNVRNVKTGKILKPHKTPCDYLQAKLFNNGKPQFLYVHVLVAKAFLPDTNKNPDGSIIIGHHQVNHRDQNKKNNNVLNLEWCDCKYNLNYSNVTKKAQDASKKKVKCIETDVVYESAYDAERKLNLRLRSISCQLSSKNNQKHCYLPDGKKVHFKYI